MRHSQFLILFLMSLTLRQAAFGFTAEVCLFKTSGKQTVRLGDEATDRVLNYLSVIGKPQGEGLGPLYQPQALVPIANHLMTPLYQKNLLNSRTNEFMQQEAYEALVKMLTDARKIKINLYVHSAYRSYDVQCTVFSRSLTRELMTTPTFIEAITAVNTRSAVPGHSEHQLGTVVDLVTFLPQYEPKIPTPALPKHGGYALEAEMQDTPAYFWLQKNAATYGYVLSYPHAAGLGLKDENPRTGYKYEPWHWRYIGVKHALNFKLCKDLVLREFLKKISENPQFNCPEKL